MSSKRTAVITGSASGMGAATAARLRSDGWRVIGIDLEGAEISADLGTPNGRDTAIESVATLVDGSVPFARNGRSPSRSAMVPK